MLFYLRSLNIKRIIIKVNFNKFQRHSRNSKSAKSKMEHIDTVHLFFMIETVNMLEAFPFPPVFVFRWMLIVLQSHVQYAVSRRAAAWRWPASTRITDDIAAPAPLISTLTHFSSLNSHHSPKSREKLIEIPHLRTNFRNNRVRFLFQDVFFLFLVMIKSHL